MSLMWRLLRAERGTERGVALLAVILAIFILTVVVAAMAIATMGESVQSFDQLRGQQALAVAEAGAYRALADLRRRVSVDLDIQIRQPSVNPTDVQDICQGINGKQRVQMITDYAYPGGTNDWARTGATGILTIGSPSVPVQISDSAFGQVIGDFYATILVRWSGLTNPGDCQLPGPSLPEHEILYYDFAILSVGRTGNATRQVCLRSQLADRCPDWDFTAPYTSFSNWQGSNVGFPVLVQKASYSEWALMLLDTGGVWLFTGTTINGPVHSNTRIKIAGTPFFSDDVTQVETDMEFFNCTASPTVFQTIGVDPLSTTCTGGIGADNPTFLRPPTGGAAVVAAPTNAVPSRTSIGLPPSGPNATDAEVQARTNDPEAAGPTLKDGVYVMDNCGSPGCGGIYVKGDVQQMVLNSVSGNQEIIISVQTDPAAARQFMRISIDPITRAVTTYWGYTGAACAPTDFSCLNYFNGASWSGTRSYGAGVFNGVIYVSGSITSSSDPSASTGLYGMVNKSMKLTVAAENEIRITDQLIYEAPPAGPGHNVTNVLGLYSVTNNVTIVGALTATDTYVDAAVLAPSSGRMFWVEGWNSLTGKGSVYQTGGTVQGTFGPFGGFSPTTGYGRVMTYDWRLRNNVSPPFFPLTDIYAAPRGYNALNAPDPIFSLGDTLYDRPQWEEMVGL